MCSIGEDDFGDDGGLHAMIPDNLKQTDGILYCKKCESSESNSRKIASTKCNFREPECNDCFLVYARHKFRATLGSSKILPRNSEVLLFFDGSSESMVLFDMLQHALSQNSFKRLHCNIKILYIDESIIHRANPKIPFEIKEFLLNYQFKSFIISIIPDIFETPYKLSEFQKYEKNVEANKNIIDKFIENFENYKTLTSKQDYLDKLRKHLLSMVARKLDCKFIFLSDFSLNLASKFITNISLGRGASTSLDVTLYDDRFDEVKFLRPLKDLTNQEIYEYIKVQNLKLFNVNEFGDEFGHSSSIQNLTKKFVLNLQKEFSSTVSTVFRTGDKIAPNTMDELDDNANPKCYLCKSYLDYINSKTMQAIEFSRFVSENAIDNLTDQQIMDKLLNQKPIGNNLSENFFCHSCRNIYNDCLDPELFL